MEGKMQNAEPAEICFSISAFNPIVGSFRRFPILSNEAIFRILVIYTDAVIDRVNR